MFDRHLNQHFEIRVIEHKNIKDIKQTKMNGRIYQIGWSSSHNEEFSKQQAWKLL